MSISLKKTETPVLGIMSGTSLDGIDLALCAFSESKKGFAFRILKASTVNYPGIWKQRLTSIKDASAEKYFAMDAMYAAYIAEQVNKFLSDCKVKPAAIASHGHTIFHQPHGGFSTQIGNGAIIAANTGITTVCDFRSLDVALKGQGAPLVPIGDKFLFPDFDACLNLGGIANISFDNKRKRVAYDVCVANMLLNYLSETLGVDYDENGDKAKSGKVNRPLLEKLNGLDYYKKSGAKSIGREWFEKNIFQLFERSDLSTTDQLATACEHIAQVISRDVNGKKIHRVLVTGGGAFNTHLINLIREKTRAEIVVPNAETVQFKEALIFAFLGFLRLGHKVNTLSTVTGAKRDSIGGAVYLGLIK